MDVASLTVKVVNEGLDTTAKGLDDLGKSAKGAAKEAEKSVSSFEKMEKSVKGFNESMSGLRNAGLVMAGALTGALYKSIGSAQEFESAMAEVKKTVDFESPKGIEDMRKGLEKLSTQIPQTFGELAATASNAGLLGVAEKDILGFTETVAKMGVAFDLQSDAVAESMAKIANVFQIPIKDIGNLGDVINHLSNNMASTAGEIIDFTKRTASMAATMGLSEESTAAFGSAMVALGMPAEVAGTAFNAFLGKLANLDGLSKRGKAAFASMGLDATEFANLMQTDAQGAILKFIETLRDMPKELQAAAAYDVLGAELAPKVLAMAAGYEEVARALEMTGDAAGSMEKEFAAISDTSANKMVLFKNNIDLVWASIGDALIPAFNDLLDAMRPFVESMTDWVRENPELVQGIIIVTGAISGLLLGITGLGLAFSGAISMAAGFQAIGAVLAPVFAGLSLPIMGVVAAIAAVIAIGVALYKNWDTVKEKAGQLGGYLSTEFTGIKESVSSVVDGIKDSFNSIVQTVSPALQAVSDVFKGTFDSFVQIAQGVLQLVVNTVKTQFMAIVTTIGAVLQIAFTVLKAGFDLMKNAVMTVMKIIVAIIDGDFKAIPKIMGEGISQGVAIVGNALGKIVDVIKDYGKRMFNLGKDFIQGFINGIKSIGSGVVSAASTMASNAVAAVRRTQDSHSPSKVTKRLGGDFAEGFAKGIKENKKPKSEAQKMAENAIKAVKDTIANLKREIALFGNDDPILAMLWDRQNTNKYGGVSDALFNEAVGLTKRKKELEGNAKAADKLASANQSVYNSVEAIDRQLYEIAAERNPYEMLLWDLENTEKYANAGAEAIELLKTKTKELFEEQERQAAVKKAKEAGDAMSQMLGGLGGEKSPLQRLQDEQDERLRIIQESMIAEGGMKQAHTDALLAIDERYEQDLQKLKLAQYGDGLGLFTRFMGSMLGENKRAKRIMFGIEKGFALATILIENKKALAKAWASAPFPYNLPIVAKTAMQTGAISAALDAVNPKGFRQGGYTGSIGADNIAGVVHGNEYVFDAQSTKAIGVENLERIRRGKGTGEVNITVNNHSSAKVETETDSQGNIIMTIRDEVKRSWSNLQNPNSHESKMLGRNVQAPRRR